MYFQLSHALQRKKTMFENVNIDWRISHDDGSTDFSDDETLEDRATYNGAPGTHGTPDRSANVPPNTGMYGSPPDGFSGSRSLEPMLGRHTPSRPKSMDPHHSNYRDNYNNNNNLINKSFTGGDFFPDRRTATSDWSGSTPSENSSDSPAPYRIMPPPPPPQANKNKFCKY